MFLDLDFTQSFFFFFTLFLSLLVFSGFWDKVKTVTSKAINNVKKAVCGNPEAHG